MITAIVNNKDLNTHFVMDDGLQLLKIHLDTSISRDQDYIFPFTGSAHAVRAVLSGSSPDTDGCRKVISHGSHC